MKDERSEILSSAVETAGQLVLWGIMIHFALVLAHVADSADKKRRSIENF
jgi:hypothetical protein